MEQKSAAVMSRDRLQLKYSQPIVTEIKRVSHFWPATTTTSSTWKNSGSPRGKGGAMRLIVMHSF